MEWIVQVNEKKTKNVQSLNDMLHPLSKPHISFQWLFWMYNWTNAASIRLCRTETHGSRYVVLFVVRNYGRCSHRRESHSPSHDPRFVVPSTGGMHKRLHPFPFHRSKVISHWSIDIRQISSAFSSHCIVIRVTGHLSTYDGATFVHDVVHGVLCARCTTTTGSGFHGQFRRKGSWCCTTLRSGQSKTIYKIME